MFQVVASEETDAQTGKVENVTHGNGEGRELGSRLLLDVSGPAAWWDERGERIRVVVVVHYSVMLLLLLLLRAMTAISSGNDTVVSWVHSCLLDRYARKTEPEPKQKMGRYLFNF